MDFRCVYTQTFLDIYPYNYWQLQTICISYTHIKSAITLFIINRPKTHRIILICCKYITTHQWEKVTPPTNASEIIIPPHVWENWDYEDFGGRSTVWILHYP